MLRYREACSIRCLMFPGEFSEDKARMFCKDSQADAARHVAGLLVERICGKVHGPLPPAHRGGRLGKTP